jgi:hypothetical protein
MPLRVRTGRNCALDDNVGLGERGSCRVKPLTVTMEHEPIELIEQIERCRRLARFLTDEQMRNALEDLAEDYEAQLKRRSGAGFMLRGG